MTEQAAFKYKYIFYTRESNRQNGPSKQMNIRYRWYDRVKKLSIYEKKTEVKCQNHTSKTVKAVTSKSSQYTVYRAHHGGCLCHPSRETQVCDIVGATDDNQDFVRYHWVTNKDVKAEEDKVTVWVYKKP